MHLQDQSKAVVQNSDIQDVMTEPAQLKLLLWILNHFYEIKFLLKTIINASSVLEEVTLKLLLIAYFSFPNTSHSIACFVICPGSGQI